MQKQLLEWFDKNQRALPWRALKGQIPNPYYVYLSEVFLQQTTVVTVIDYFHRFIKKWPTLKDLAHADLHEILNEFQGLGYYSRAKNLHKAITLFNEHGGIPKTYTELLKYPGIGDYTAKAVAAIAFNEPVIPIDGNVIRVFSRYFGMSAPLPSLKNDVLQKTLSMDVPKNSGDFAQSLMDLGSMICKPKNPLCNTCPIKKECYAFKNNLVTFFPQKLPKISKPKKSGKAFVYHTEDSILIQKNPNTGLLSNLWGVPTSEWVETLHLPPKSNNSVTHVFTHFTLHLTLQRISIQSLKDFPLEENQIFVKKSEIQNYPFSTLMKKVLRTSSLISF
jgi:A/G-specific adenine glycosylase